MFRSSVSVYKRMNKKKFRYWIRQTEMRERVYFPRLVSLMALLPLDIANNLCMLFISAKPFNTKRERSGPLKQTRMSELI